MGVVVYLVSDQELCDWAEMVLDLLRGVEGDESPHLFGHLLAEPPVPVVVHLEKLVEPWQVLSPILLFEQLQEVGQMLQQPDTNLVQILHTRTP